MWRICLDPNNASKWQMGFNLGFKGLIQRDTIFIGNYIIECGAKTNGGL